MHERQCEVNFPVYHCSPATNAEAKEGRIIHPDRLYSSETSASWFDLVQRI